VHKKFIMIEKYEYPKVLVVDALPFSWTTNGGIVKSNLFKGWPADRLVQIDYSNTKPEFDVCSNYWMLKKWNILKGLIGDASCAELSKESYNHTPLDEKEMTYESRHSIERKLSVLPLKLRLLIGESVFRLPSLLSKSLRRWIDDFQPDVIFTTLGLPTILRTVVKVSQYKNIPIVPYFTDDWINTLYKDDAIFRLWHRRNMLYWFKECLHRSPISMTICDAMNDEYTKRYGGHFESFMTLVDFKNTPLVDNKTITISVVRLTFIGSLDPNRWQCLRAIGEALLDLRGKGIEAELLIYTFPDHIEKYCEMLTIEPVMKVMGTATYDQVEKLQKESDVLVHVESFENSVREYTKFSVSTKITQYMMSDTCVFAYGPGEVASLRFLSDSNAGVTVGEENPELLRAVLSRLITDPAFRQSTVGRAKEIVLEKNESSRQRNRFKELIIDSCNEWQASNNSKI